MITLLTSNEESRLEVCCSALQILALNSPEVIDMLCAPEIVQALVNKYLSVSECSKGVFAELIIQFWSRNPVFATIEPVLEHLIQQAQSACADVSLASVAMIQNILCSCYEICTSFFSERRSFLEYLLNHEGLLKNPEFAQESLLVLNLLHFSDAVNLFEVGALEIFSKIYFRTEDEEVKYLLFYSVQCMLMSPPARQFLSGNLQQLVELQLSTIMINMLQSNRDANSCLIGVDRYLAHGEGLVSDVVLYNPFAIQFEECGGVKELQRITASFQTYVTTEAKKILDKYYGESYQQFLLRRRGLSTKSARHPH